MIVHFRFKKHDHISCLISREKYKPLNKMLKNYFKKSDLLGQNLNLDRLEKVLLLFRLI